MAFRELLKLIKEDCRHHGGTGFAMVILTYLYNASFRLVLNYRIGSYLVKRRNPLVNIVVLHLKRKQLLRRNSDISYNCSIGRNIRFPHPLGIVIGEGVVIHDNVSIWQQVTLGSHGKVLEEVSYPVIENHVKIYTGAKILGPIKIGERSVIGANSVVIKNVLPGSTVVGIPGREIKKYEA
jgi:serine O-acetyltransferase